ncbi:hypothetical protein COLO4_04767 [Corchorus olitorius]|uniref:Uncharacterized protein n=1 Tax=Corchorus olitorius TaxID=93759 RepID=A0A1R3KSZ9_9ROSI|nr:hypothetical protein COLO4_04767 [Corchorus olitorius]
MRFDSGRERVVEDDKIRRLRWQNELAKEMRNPLSQVNFYSL